MLTRYWLTDHTGEDHLCSEASPVGRWCHADDVSALEADNERLKAELDGIKERAAQCTGLGRWEHWPAWRLSRWLLTGQE